MKNLDLNNYGVQEMNEKEMKAVDGGWSWLGAIVGALAGFVIGGPVGAGAGFLAGGLSDEVPIKLGSGSGSGSGNITKYTV